jgi:magnesium-transporting ATPase (P-type)
MTQSVIIETQKGKTYAFVKGSSESIKRLCSQDSLPPDFDDSVKQSAKEGIYQISMAMKEVDSDWQGFSRSELERGVTFIGVLNFKNILREETIEVLNKLKEGDVDSIMVTGDNILTGIHIAKECGIIQSEVVLIGTEVTSDGNILWLDETGTPSQLPTIENVKRGETGVDLTIFGSVWESILDKDSNYAMQLVEHIRVFGRCTPIGKKSVVIALNEKGYITSMCGDGSNDCGALKAAHVGIALSDSDASIISPFTSLNKTITSVVDVLLEGRCAIASALASYKYMIMVSPLKYLI